ncbi:hypothetical protein [Shouchella lonarensis]|uniref:hypothetical protein n=1 Tax=Shouchella lonarensis TaxID=1464122 RepID=UPI0015A367C1|nr:hypothetical protein [Shouchella lonarensis]
MRRIDQEYDMHLQAWLHVQAGATKETGGKTRPVYDRFNKFYDYKKRLRELEKMESHKLKPTYARMATAASMANQGREG